MVALEPALRTWRAATDERTAEGRAHWRAREAAVETERRDIVGCERRRGAGRRLLQLRRLDVVVGTIRCTSRLPNFPIRRAENLVSKHVTASQSHPDSPLSLRLLFIVSTTRLLLPLVNNDIRSINMVKRKEAPDGEVTTRSTRKSPRSTTKSSTMSDSAKPKSSTSEASKKQAKRPITKRSNDSDDDDDSSDDTSEPAKHRTSATKAKVPITKSSKAHGTKKKVTQISTNNDDEESEDAEDESEEEKPKKRATITKSVNAKKEALKRAYESDNDDVEEVVAPSRSSIKANTNTSASPAAKKQLIEPPLSSRDIVENYNDESDEDDSQPKTSESLLTKKSTVEIDS